MDVMSPSIDALGAPLSNDFWFYNYIMLFGEVRAEKQKGHVTKYHLVQKYELEESQNFDEIQILIIPRILNTVELAA